MSQPPTDKIAEHWLIEGDKTLGITSLMKGLFCLV